MAVLFFAAGGTLFTSDFFSVIPLVWDCANTFGNPKTLKIRRAMIALVKRINRKFEQIYKKNKAVQERGLVGKYEEN